GSNGGHAARPATAAEIGDPLRRLDQDEPSLLPEALAGEIPTGKVFRQCEGGGPDPPHLSPIANPVHSLLGSPDRDGAQGASARANPAPQSLARGESTEHLFHAVQVNYGIGGGRRDTPGAQEPRELILVLAQLDDGAGGKEDTAGEVIAECRRQSDIGV